MVRVKDSFLASKKIPFYIFLLVWLVSCGQVEDQAKGFETIAQGISSGIITERLEAIRDQMKWSEFWSSHAGADSQVPSINFISETVIVVHLGTRPSAPGANAAANITRVENQLGKLVVHYDEAVPGSGCFTDTFFPSQPHHMIKIPRNDEEPTFIKTIQNQSCL